MVLFSSHFSLLSFLLGDLRETAYRPRRCNRLKTHRCALPSFHTASAKEDKRSRGKVWLPKPRTYCGENEYSIRPHKPNSVGATPASATNLPKRESGVANRLLAERTFVYGRGREWLGRPTRDCKGLPVVNFYSLGVVVAQWTLTP